MGARCTRHCTELYIRQLVRAGSNEEETLNLCPASARAEASARVGFLFATLGTNARTHTHYRENGRSIPRETNLGHAILLGTPTSLSLSLSLSLRVGCCCQRHGRVLLAAARLRLVLAEAAAGRFPLAEIHGWKTFREGAHRNTGIGRDSMRVRVCVYAVACQGDGRRDRRALVFSIMRVKCYLPCDIRNNEYPL